MRNPYIIIEAANTHGGNYDYLLELIDAFSHFKKGYGIKFQAFHPDRIALNDYTAYELYKKLHFNKKQWKNAIQKAAETKDVWLDIFDTYGVEIFRENIKSTKGIKFQSSVLYNFEVIQALGSVDMKNHLIILNVAAQPFDNISEIIERVQTDLRPKEILLEFGYQAYPTSVEDSGYSKLEIIRSEFRNRLVFADHVDGESEDAIWLPVIVSMNGIDIIEKHVMLDSRETKYDHFSSLTPGRFENMVSRISQYINLKKLPFINNAEKEYLNNTIMVPVLKNDKEKGSLLSFEKDFIYRRTGKKGLNAKEISYMQSDFHVLAVDKKAGETLRREDFKKAVIATIIACRLKSSRLPRKAVLPIGGIPSVERCIKSCLEFENVNYTVLATSDVEEDAELENYTYRKDVIFHRGDPDDVIRRYLGIAEKLNVDIIIRITADMPFVSHEIVNVTLKQHFMNGADYSAPREMSVGTAAEVINTNALQKVKKYFSAADYSEYMTWYFQNNPEHFNLNVFDLPSELIRDYRLTLDYPEDLEMFNSLQLYFDEENIEFDIRRAFKFLDENPQINKINSHLTLRYKTDSELISTLDRVTKIKE